MVTPYSRLMGAPRNMKIILRIQGAKGSRIQVKGMECKTLEPSNPGILGPYFCTKNGETAQYKAPPILP
jgi:hypothetical protein